MKKYRLHKRLIKNLFCFIEKKYPRISDFLRYHSVVQDPYTFSDCRIETKKIDWLKDQYLDSFKKLNKQNKDILIEEHKLNIYTLKTEDYIIHGNIKHPVRKSNGKVLRFYPSENLTLTDAYPNPFFRKKFVQGTVIFIPNNENYYHLMVDYLLPAVLEILSNEKEHRFVTILCQKKFPFIDVLQKILTLRNIQSTKINIHSYDQFTGGELLLRGTRATHPQIQSIFPEELGKLKSLVGLSDPVTAYDRIYITRKNANRRKILNEENLIPILEKNNIKIIELDFNDPEKQLNLFQNASLIISIHGASLTNVIWSDNAKIVEIFPKNLTPIHYLNFSAQLGHKYFYFLGTPADPKENFELDLVAFDHYISQIIDV